MAKKRRPAPARRKKREAEALAPVNRRILAHAIDGLILGALLVVPLTIALNIGNDDEPFTSPPARAIFLVIMVFAAMYEMTFIARRGATPGKRLAGVRVARLDGTVPGGERPSSGTWRQVASPSRWCSPASRDSQARCSASFPSFSLSQLLISVSRDPRRRGWHDHAAGTIALDTREQPF